MTLLTLKEIYLKSNNINFVNLINKIEDMSITYNISINKIITYLQSNCTSKIEKKYLNLLSQHYPYQGELTLDEVYKINNKQQIKTSDYIFDGIETNEIKPTEIKIEKFVNSTLKAKKKRKSTTNDIEINNDNIIENNNLED